jgi:hypothetical protein
VLPQPAIAITAPIKAAMRARHALGIHDSDFAAVTPYRAPARSESLAWWWAVNFLLWRVLRLRGINGVVIFRVP